MWGLYCGIIGFEKNVITMTRKRLLDPKLWYLEAPRCYLYSEADKLIDWRDVHSHVEESLEEKIPTREIRFEDTDHVDHSRSKHLVYWSAVLDTWNDARKLYQIPAE
jgi:chromosome condensin MukBEF complex kleisin-like MukF subunit